MQLPEELAHARNLNVAVRESGDTVVFLHRLEAGGTDRSYGIHVGQLAGLPSEVVRRARSVLQTLEGDHRVVPGVPLPPDDPGQLDPGTVAGRSSAHDLRYLTRRREASCCWTRSGVAPRPTTAWPSPGR